MALVGPAPELAGGPTLTWDHPRHPGKALFALNDVQKMASWGSTLGHGCQVCDKLAKARELLSTAMGAVSGAFGAMGEEVLPRG